MKMMPRRLLSLWLPANLQPGSVQPGSVAPDEALALWCQQYTPLTALQPPDGVLLDITGCAHLFGGEAALKAHLLARLPGARLAIAGTAAAAWALARYAAVTSEGSDEDLTGLPLAALGLAEPTIARLRRVGIRRIGQLMRLPRAELTAGFGPEPLRRLECALGRAPEAQHFIGPPPDWRETARFAEPILTPAQLHAACARLAATLCARLAASARGATALTARFHLVDRKLPEFTLRFALPCRDEFQIGKLCREQLNRIDPGFGVEAVSLHAVLTEPLAAVQHAIETSAQPAAPDHALALNTLLNRLGTKRLWRAAAHETHIPEYASRRLPVTATPPRWPRPPHRRPLRLLARPAPITAIAPVPDEPPLLFTWRGASHRIAAATGPERIARDWWRRPPDDVPETERIRDYYEVEDISGARFWVFRAGTHGGAAPVRWYLHGFFG
jgi:protein ImuB